MLQLPIYRTSNELPSWYLSHLPPALLIQWFFLFPFGGIWTRFLPLESPLLETLTFFLGEHLLLSRGIHHHLVGIYIYIYKYVWNFFKASWTFQIYITHPKKMTISSEKSAIFQSYKTIGSMYGIFTYMILHVSGQIITTSADVTLNGGEK